MIKPNKNIGRIFFKQPEKLIFNESISDIPPKEINAGANQNIIAIGINNNEQTNRANKNPELKISAGFIDSGLEIAPNPPAPANIKIPKIITITIAARR